MQFVILSSCLDQFLFAILCLAIWFIADRFLFCNLRSKIARLRIGVTVALLVVLAIFVSFQVGHFQRSQLKDSIVGFAPTYAIELSKLGHQQITLETAADDPLYLELIERQKCWLEHNPTAHDIYSMRLASDGTLKLIVDSETDYDRNGRFEGEREQRTAIGEEYFDPSQLMLEAAHGSANFDEVPYSDRWGVWVSAHAPLFNSQGEVDGLVGVDFSAHQWIQTILFARLASLLIGFATVAGYIGTTVIISLLKQDLERERIALQREQQAISLRMISEQAQQANHAKGQFLANMSHEIRTPMNGIMGLTELLLNTDLQTDQRSNLELISSSADALMTVLNDILDFSKIEANKMTLDPHPFDLREMLGDAMKLFGLRAHQKQIELAFHVPTDFPEVVLGDAGRIRQVLVNLVGNAIKFTHQGEIIVSVEQIRLNNDSNHMKFSVRDSGVGIDAEKLDKIFEPFSQADNSTTRKFGGTGLGLTICQRLVELLGGQLEIQSQLGVGTTISFTLVCTQPTADLTVARGGDQIVLENLRILVVDDNGTNRLILKEMLAHWQVEATVVNGGKEVCQIMELAHAENRAFDLVLMDVQMPEMDGFETTRQIRRHAKIANTRVIMLSSCDASAYTEQCREIRLSAYLTKPIKQSELLESIMAVLKRTNPEYRTSVANPSYASPRPAVNRITSSLKILVAEDNFVNQQLMLRVLQQDGHHVLLANHGGEAIAMLKHESVDVVIMDVNMPVVDGHEATIAIRQAGLLARSGQRLPVIALTANAMIGNRERCIEAGMDDYVTKPIQFARLFETINRHVAQQDSALDPPQGTESTRLISQAFEPDANPNAAKADNSFAAILATDSALDWPILNQAELMDRIDGDLELLEILVAAYGNDVGKLVENLRAAIDAADPTMGKKIAHTIKGTAANLGGVRVTKAAAELEKALTLDDVPRTKAWLTLLGESVLLLGDELQALSSSSYQACSPR